MDQLESQVFLTNVIKELQRIKSYWNKRLKIAAVNSINRNKSKKAIALCSDAVESFINFSQYIQNHNELGIVDQCIELKSYWNQQQNHFGFHELLIDEPLSTLVVIYDLIIDSIDNIEIITKRTIPKKDR
ncbi:hypothetical protein [Enterococcus termitis]|uniref:Uncharacterized protein n=1 Tax=Enterococcus termitis TaxID=332950 RepID=A0A1E5GAZ2_9ENTE|nr:hypothetical protein [Enterococcus termitis]OEG09872.1 hypothetical protein BCR25_10235 [Enterococcus termitis]OJG98379.1 hypothetical protein RV18_GL003280 [Enterococcus termitis]